MDIWRYSGLCKFFGGDYGSKNERKSLGNERKYAGGTAGTLEIVGSEQPQIRKTAPRKESGPRLVELGITLSNRYLSCLELHKLIVSILLHNYSSANTRNAFLHIRQLYLCVNGDVTAQEV